MTRMIEFCHRRLLTSLCVAAGLLLSPASRALDWTGLRPIGAATACERTENGVVISCQDGAHVQLSMLATDLVRVRTLFAGQADEPDHSWAIARSSWDKIPFELSIKSDILVLATSELEVVVHRDPLLIEFRDAATHKTLNSDERPAARDPSTGRVAAAKRLGFDEHFYGLGEKAARLDRRRGQFVMWNSDTPGYVEGADPIYQSIPFYIGWEQGRAYGLFYDNSHRSLFDLGHTGQEHAAYSAEGGVLDEYFFQGPSIKKILGRYTELTGRMPMPPLWALGNQQCRYSYYPDSMLEQVARTYREHDLPLDVLYLDIHYMNGYRVFTWDPKRFPDPSALTASLAKQGVKVVTIIDPGVKYQPLPEGAAVPAAAKDPSVGAQEPSYYVFNEGLAGNHFVRRKDGSIYVGEVWPGKAVFVDFTREDSRRWWGGLHRALLDHGIAGVWTDMNEPSDFVDKSGESQKDLVFDDLGARTLYNRNRNVFALNMARATYEGLQALRPDKRPFVITRAAYAGIQRYSTMWTGDNNATFESLALNIPMFASLGLSGQSFVGADIPGFMGRGSGELLARSYELAFLLPLCRNHAAVDDYDHEPWRYGSAYEAIVRKYLKLRYSLMPFLYTTLEEAHRTGVPLFRPLLLNFQEDADTLGIDDEFMVGDALLAAPVVREGQRSRELYLPKGRWYDYWTGAAVEGGSLRTVAAPLDTVPLYVRGGSILPSTEPMRHTGEKPWNPLRFDIYPDASGNAAGSLYEDDGESPAYLNGAFRRSRFSFERNGATATLTIAAPEGSHRVASRQLWFVVQGEGSLSQVSLDDRPLGSHKPGESGQGTWRDPSGLLWVGITDDGQPHTLRFH